MQLFNAGFFKFIPLTESQMRKRKGRVGASWRMNKTYIKIKGILCYLYRVVDKPDNTVDFLLIRTGQRMSPAKSILSEIEVLQMLRKNKVFKSGMTI